MVIAIKPEIDLPSALAVRIPAAGLKSALATLARIADRKSHLAMLAKVLIRIDASGVVTLAATDLNVSATFTAPAWQGTPGEICVDAKSLADIAKGLSGTEVTLCTSGPLGLRVDDGNSEITLIGVSGRDFPKLS